MIEKENNMNDDVLAGKWKQLKGGVKTAFAKLTDDDIAEVEGNTERLLGKLQERYGYTRDDAENAWNKFVDNVDDKVDEAAAERHVDRAADHVENAVDEVKDAVRRVLS